jgi:transposase
MRVAIATANRSDDLYCGAGLRLGHRDDLDFKIVKRSDQVSGFVVLPKRWIVERTIAWLNRCRSTVTRAAICRTTQQAATTLSRAAVTSPGRLSIFFACAR